LSVARTQFLQGFLLRTVAAFAAALPSSFFLLPSSFFLLPF
jgi:hypothetical protein